MKDVPDQVVDEFVRACHLAAEQGLMRCSSGNISRRLDHDRMLATASRSWAATLSSDQISMCRIADGSLLEGPRQTVEIGIHAGVMRTRPDVHVVIHFQTPCATTLACRSGKDIDYCVIPEVPYYIGNVATVPYLLPGSPELAEAVTAALQEHDLVVMRNHGMVTVGTDYKHAIQNAVFFELACEIMVHGGDDLSPLSPAHVERLIELRKGV